MCGFICMVMRVETCTSIIIREGFRLAACKGGVAVPGVQYGHLALPAVRSNLRSLKSSVEERWLI